MYAFKKEAELESLHYFIEAYMSMNGQSIEVSEISERPDFICTKQDGNKIGVELVKVRRGHPNDIIFDRLIEKRDYMSLNQALIELREVVLEKERKRCESDWKFPDATMLVVEMVDIPLTEIKGYIKPDTLPDLYNTGFAELWLVDITGIDAYANVQLFCVQPDKWAGFYPRCLQKPYG